MKPREIIPEETLDEYSDTDEKIVKHLKKKGYKLLGQGVDQTAFLEPDGQNVLKIFGTQSDARAPKGLQQKPTFSKDHMMFFRWAKYCNKHSDNPFLPKFSGAESFYWNKQVYLQIRQERMYPLESMLAYMMADMADDAAEGYSFNEVLDVISDDYNKELHSLKQQVGMSGLKLLYKTLDKITRIGENEGWTQDLHDGNFLSRTPDGRFPVIVDPWVA